MRWSCSGPGSTPMTTRSSLFSTSRCPAPDRRRCNSRTGSVSASSRHPSRQLRESLTVGTADLRYSTALGAPVTSPTDLERSLRQAEDTLTRRLDLLDQVVRFEDLAIERVLIEGMDSSSAHGSESSWRFGWRTSSRFARGTRRAGDARVISQSPYRHSPYRHPPYRHSPSHHPRSLQCRQNLDEIPQFRSDRSERFNRLDGQQSPGRRRR
jgi:hypothetical protein